MRSGNVYLNNTIDTIGTARSAGINGYGWSQVTMAFTDVKSATTYDLGFYATEVNHSAGPGNRWNGFSLRCLSTALEG